IDGFEQALKRIPNVGIVIDDDDGSRLAHGAPSSVDRVNCSRAPCDGAGEAHSRPPCPSRIERQIDRPIPIPPALVVNNGENIRWGTGGWSRLGNPPPPRGYLRVLRIAT